MWWWTWGNGWPPERRRATASPVAPRSGGGRQRRDQGAGDSELVGDCEAFLAGHLAERVEAQAGVVPVWAWTNLLAHGSEDDVRSACSTTRFPRRAPDVWRDARSHLATELLELAERYGPLVEVQRSVLVPLELEHASSVEVAGWGPRQWEASVEAALGRHRRVSRRNVTRHPPSADGERRGRGARPAE
jgi:hypothetical protein